VGEGSGASEEFVRRLVELGIVTSGTDSSVSLSDIQRVQLASELERSGMSLDALAAAVHSGDLSFDAVDAMFPDPAVRGSRTLGETAEELGLSLETVHRLYALWGLASPGADDPIREGDAAVLGELASLPPGSLVYDLLVHGAGVVGETAHRIADLAFDFVRSIMAGHQFRPSSSAQQPMDPLGRFSGPAGVSLGHQIAWLVGRQVEIHATQLVIEYVESAIESAGVLPNRTASPPAISFVDLTGYSTLTEQEGDEAAAQDAITLAEIVRDVVHDRGGQVLKLLGDGAMLYFADAGTSVAAGLELVDRVAASGLPSARVGIAAGPVVFRDGDCYGRTVNIAARILDRADPGQVVTTTELVGVTNEQVARFEDVGEVLLKGLSAPVSMVVASRTP
jgi:adenylate cyclase